MAKEADGQQDGRRLRNRELKFTDNVVFKTVMRDEDICKGVIERVTGLQVGEVAYVNTEQEQGAIPTGKWMRGDAYLVEANGRLYDVEIQLEKYAMLPKRFRGYQSILDATTLASGKEYTDLKESWIVFICTGDPFRAGNPVYRIERVCKSDAEVVFDCGAHWLALNASAWRDVENPGLRNLLRYVSTGYAATDDVLVEHIESEVAKVNKWNGGSGMLLDTRDMIEQEARAQGLIQGLEEGREKGREEGRKEFSSLAALLLERGEDEDLRALLSNPAEFDRLREKYGD